MARSKTRLLKVSDDCRYVHVQIEQDNGDIIQGRYSLFCWDKPPQDVLDSIEAAVKSGPVGIIGPMDPNKS